MMTVGTKAPEVVAQDQNGKTRKLADYKGRWVVLYFYPKDFTSGCTTEACSFRDNFDELQKMGVVVLGVSKDSVESHKKFAEEYKLNFPLLADTDKKIYSDYAVTSRTTFLIDPAGMIKKIYENVNPAIHTKQIIEDLKNLKTTR